ncbi:MAG: hypothetical protein COB93_00260 [Sneathiella sp.]|nr:MAG: hypothetical protein COB93_00260 [Sneathiella sp.]
MSIKYFRDEVGKYLGSYGVGATVPDGAIECPAPLHADANWNGTDWDAYTPPPIVDPNDVDEFETVAKGVAKVPLKRLFLVPSGEDKGLYLNRSGGALRVGVISD